MKIKFRVWDKRNNRMIMPRKFATIKPVIDFSYKQKGYYVDDPEGEIVGINHYCMNCGKRLEVEP